jgi:hypothetical protein
MWDMVIMVIKIAGHVFPRDTRAYAGNQLSAPVDLGNSLERVCTCGKVTKQRSWKLTK